ncbi:SAM-dependent methyltransferase [Pedomonas mirosovicensis]|uniref:SAM-dependent methyltransferase n=1 Tax=Pedomonas mirosovicensis TaxID=2908641 RepID=UPI002168F0BF|nr:SAM-dependent methyltransferase [Pedomonas mirosovicensis]MCH8685312.1 class I SAM-dependent methyltransferase [Pedomonas mirosovicensis]
MQPAGRLAAAIEILDEAIASARSGGAAADVLLARYFRARRYAGSKDRAAVRTWVYAVLRHMAFDALNGRAATIAYAREREPELLGLFGSGGHGPAALSAEEAAASAAALENRWLPEWLEARFMRRFKADWPTQRAGLMERAPLDLRVNTLRAARDEAQKALRAGGIESEALPFVDNGLRADAGAPVEKSDAFADGLVEVQDLASQLMLAMAKARPGETVIDLCAGAGGKTLGLAADMQGKGRLIACDIDPARLERMEPRLRRAGVSLVEQRVLRPGALDDLTAQADCVVIDAPCSGTGTWRRNPEARLRLTEERLAAVTTVQDEVLRQGAALVKPGGRLVYAVCSLLPDEAEDRLEAFLEQYPGFRPVDYHRRLSETGLPETVALRPEWLAVAPASHGCDGFFVAVFERVC